MKVYMSAKAYVKIHQERPRLENGVLRYEQVGEDDLVPNILTDAGRVTLHTYIYGTTAQRALASLGTGMNYIGLSDDGVTPAPGDATLTGEFLTNGLERAAADVTLPTGVEDLTIVSHLFTYAGIPNQTMQKTALFDAVTGGYMAHEILFPQRILGTGDTITLTFQITLT